MKAAGQLRSQYLCFNTLPWATWTYHPSLGYSDCVFKNDVEKGVTQEIVYVPSTYWSDCNSVNQVDIPTSEEVNDDIIKCNVKADGSVTLLSDLDFQARSSPKDVWGRKRPSSLTTLRAHAARPLRPSGARPTTSLLLRAYAPRPSHGISHALRVTSPPMSRRCAAARASTSKTRKMVLAREGHLATTLAIRAPSPASRT